MSRNDDVFLARRAVAVIKALVIEPTARLRRVVSSVYTSYPRCKAKSGTLKTLKKRNLN